jgi:hypothetical protein
VTLAIANRKEALSQDERQNLIMQYQELQVQAVALARQIYRRNKQLLDQDQRQRLEEMVEIMNSNAHASLSNEINQGDVTKLLEERFNMLEGFIPEFENRLDKQLDRISRRLSDS